MTEREFALDVVRQLQGAGFQALWAGGCVRDELLGLHPHDFDVATDARPEQVIKMFRRSIAVGAAFGVIEVVGPRGPHHKHITVEVATFRSDGTYTDGRRPDSVTFSTPEEDAKRRDFTINGMFFDPVKEQIHDFVGGRADLEAKVLRAIGEPRERFEEDKLRILRAVRIAARFLLKVDSSTLEAAKAMAPQITVVSVERIAEELRKLLVHPNRVMGVWGLLDFGLIQPILPELEPLLSSWGRVSNPVDGLRPEPISFPLAFAAVLIHVGQDAAGRIGDRLKLSTAEKQRITWLVENHQVLLEAPTMRLSQLKPLLVHPGIEELLALHRAVARNGVEHIEFCERKLRDTPSEELDPPPLVTGNDLKEIGLEPGPLFKRLLDAVRDSQLDEKVRTKVEALKLVQELLQASARESGAP